MTDLPAGGVPSAQEPPRGSRTGNRGRLLPFRGRWMRVRVCVDGFNLCYRALKGTDLRWLNPLALARSLLDPRDAIDRLRCFTARISARAGDTDAPRRQQAYLAALGTVPEVTVHTGRFLAKERTRPLAEDPATFVWILDFEEKGSDVNLAAHLLMDAWRDRFDLALVMSQDTDLCEPLRMVRDVIGKDVGVVWLDGREPGRRFVGCSSFVRHATPARLRAAQFPAALRDRRGREVLRPEGW